MSRDVTDSLRLKRISADLIEADRDLRPCPGGDGIYGITSYAAAQRKKEMRL